MRAVSVGTGEDRAAAVNQLIVEASAVESKGDDELEKLLGDPDQFRRVEHIREGMLKADSPADTLGI
jgi:hypothetical protein